MNEETTNNTADCDTIENSITDLPFQIGDIVQMRAKDLKIIKFRKFPPNDFGIVIVIKKQKYSSYWMVKVLWQKYITKKISNIKHVRLKKVRVKKDV